MSDLSVSKKIDLKVKEAKHLNGKINSHCIISIDLVEQYQTLTVSESDNPLWGYKNTFDRTADFEKMKITIYNQQQLGDKKKYGDVTLSKRELTAGVNGWYPIQPIIPKVRGKVWIQFKYYKPKGDNTNHSVSVTVMRAQGLNNGCSDALPTTQAVLHLIPNLISHTTAIKPKNSNPEFMEYFTFNFKEILDITKIYISFWDPVVFASNTSESSLGYVSVLVSELVEKGPTWQTCLDILSFDTLPNAATDASSTIINVIRNQEKGIFICETPMIHNFKKSAVKNVICQGCKSKILRNSVTCTHCLVTAHHSCVKSCRECTGLGMIYIDAKYEEQMILPLKMYDPFMDFLFQDSFALPQYLERMSEERDETLEIMMRLMDSKGKSIDFLKTLILGELRKTNEIQTLFRSNSYATKNIDIYMKRHGKVFMKKVLESTLVYIRNPEINCELDPDRLGKTDKLDANIANLERCCGLFLGDLLKNIHLIPLGMRDLFTFIRSAVVQKFGATLKTGYTSIGCFLILRFFGPALVSPSNYGLIEGSLNAQTRRNLILVSKTIQNLSNFVKFGSKEPFMKVMNNFLEKTHNNFELIIDLITNPDTHVPKFIARVNPLENACDADHFCRILLKAEKSNHFLDQFGRKTDILLLLRSIERKKDVISAKMQNGVITPMFSPSAEEIKKSSNAPPPRQSSASWKPPRNDFVDAPETVGIEFHANDKLKTEEMQTRTRHLARSSRRRSSYGGHFSSHLSVISDDKQQIRDSFRFSAISTLSSLSDLDADLEFRDANRKRSIFGTL